MQTYIVGGAVRDALLGLPVNDRDWVVVGATPQQLIAAGYLPVGKDFPVFLHPQTREEYALARTERKTAAGYHGFVFHAEPTVTLEDDLARRDLTINAMAQDASGRIVDPHGGQADLKARVMRHVTAAFREDPVRILRVARFMARFDDFTLAPETLALMREMVGAGEVDALVAERVWQEIARGLMEANPARMIDVLRQCGALQRLLPELDAMWDAPLAAVLDTSARVDAPLPVRFACLVYRLQDDMRTICERLRVPVECRELAEVVAREWAQVQASTTMDAAAVLHLLERCDAFRKPQRFEQVLLTCECIAGSHAQSGRLMRALAAAQAVSTADIASRAQASGVKGPGVGEMIHDARVDAVARALQSPG